MLTAEQYDRWSLYLWLTGNLDLGEAIIDQTWMQLDPVRGDDGC